MSSSLQLHAIQHLHCMGSSVTGVHRSSDILVHVLLRLLPDLEDPGRQMSIYDGQLHSCKFTNTIK